MWKESLMMKPKKAFGSGWKPGLVTCAFLYGVASHENPVHEIFINFAGSVIGPRLPQTKPSVPGTTVLDGLISTRRKLHGVLHNRQKSVQVVIFVLIVQAGLLV